MRVHPATFRAAKLYWQLPAILGLIFAALVFTFFFKGKEQQRAKGGVHMVNVAVSAVTLSENETFTADRITWRKLAPALLPRDYIGNKKSLIGCRAAGPIPAAYPVTPIMIKGNCAALREEMRAG